MEILSEFLGFFGILPDALGCLEDAENISSRLTHRLPPADKSTHQRHLPPIDGAPSPPTDAPVVVSLKRNLPRVFKCNFNGRTQGVGEGGGGGEAKGVSPSPSQRGGGRREGG